LPSTELIDEGIPEGDKEQVVKTVVDLSSISKEYVASGQTVRAIDGERPETL
jgi:hypothetical protein